jgi:hypothetical protein
MSEVIAAPWPGRSLPGPGRFRAVVAREHHDGVVANPQVIKCIEDLSDVRVDLGKGVREIAESSFARKFRVWQRREMY